MADREMSQRNDLTGRLDKVYELAAVCVFQVTDDRRFVSDRLLLAAQALPFIEVPG